MFQLTGITQPKGLVFTNYASLLSDLVSFLLRYAILGAGIIFFLRLVGAGYAFLTSGGDSGKTAGAAKEITNAVIGLAIVLSVFFIAQLLQVIFGISILGQGGTIVPVQEVGR